VRGRPRTPTALRVLRGNPGQRRLPKGEPQPERGAEPPTWLPVAARKEWNKLAPMLDRLGVLTEADGETLAQLCAARAILRQQLLEHERFSVELWRAIQAAEAKFGLTPADRARLSVVEKDKSELGKFLAEGG